MSETTTMPAPVDLALPQEFPPAVFGHAYQPHRPRYRETPTLHRADSWQFSTPEGLPVACTAGFALRIANPQAVLPGTNEYAAYDELELLTALARINIVPARLCKRHCFSAELRETYIALYSPDPLVTQMLVWEHVTGQMRRKVTVSADAAAVIAEAISCPATQSTGEPTGQPLTGPVTVTLSGHADALIAGMVGPPDTGNSTVVDDPKRVWKQGIYASDATWAEVSAAFPSSLATERDMTAMDFGAVLAEVREAFPLSVFRQWAEASLRFADHDLYAVWDNLGHYYNPEAGF
jgi:hypothetical protein